MNTRNDASFLIASAFFMYNSRVLFESASSVKLERKRDSQRERRSELAYLFLAETCVLRRGEGQKLS